MTLQNKNILHCFLTVYSNQYIDLHINMGGNIDDGIQYGHLGSPVQSLSP